MNRPYIKTIVESYLIDREILDDSKYEEYNKYIVDSIDYMKENYECAYVVVHDMTKIEQQRYIYELLDDLELVEEVVDPISIIGTIGVIVASVGTAYLINKSAYNLLVKLSDYFTDKKIKVIETLMQSKVDIKRYKVTRKIVSSNFSDCKKKVGIDLKAEDNKLLQALTPKRTVWGLRTKESPEDIEKALALRDCYLDYIISTIATLSTIYTKCLIETGEVSDQSISTDHGLSALLNYPIGENCQVLYDKLDDQHSAFLDTIYVFFKDDPRERQNWIKRLDEKIRGAKSGEHLRPSAPVRKPGGFQRGKFVSKTNIGFSERYVNPTAPLGKRYN